MTLVIYLFGEHNDQQDVSIEQQSEYADDGERHSQSQRTHGKFAGLGVRRALRRLWGADAA